MKLMGTTRDQDFVPTPSMQSICRAVRHHRWHAGSVPQLRERSLPVRFAGGANVSEAARSALQAWKEGSFNKAPKNKYGR